MRFARWLALGLGVLCVAGLSLVIADQEEASDAEEPRKIGLVEKTTGQLAQLDVTVRGPRPQIEELTAEDFELVIAGKFIGGFLVDRVCELPEEEPEPVAIVAEEEPVEQPAPAPAPAPARPAAGRASYLFYFDHHHLRPSGRQNALDIARSLIPELIVDGNRATIVSAGEKLVTFAELTDDHAVLLDAIERIEKDRTQWDQYPYQEELRVREVLEKLRDDTRQALALARQHQREESFRTDKALRLFSMVLGRLADLDPPKAAVYFGDTVRSNPGEHYLSFFGQSQRERDPTTSASVQAIGMSAFAGANAFDRVVKEAGALGVRVYTVQAEGLVNPSSVVPLGGSTRQARPTASTRHIVDAQNTLQGLAKETGGQAFLNGVPAAKIARRISGDLDCLYLLSFDPEGLALDQSLPVVVRVKRSKIRAHARGSLVLQSESSRVTSRLMAAFVSPEGVRADWPLRGVIIPTGFDEGRFHSLVQVTVPGSPLPKTEWDLGLSLVSRGRVREDASSRISVATPGVPVVLEKELTFTPGPFEIVMVARELNSDQIATAQIEGAWPDPGEEAATIGPIAVLQPSAGAFLRDGELRTRGALGKDNQAFAATDLPTVLVGLICRNKASGGRLRVERRLAGDDAAEFPPIELEKQEGRCAQIRDRIPAGTMTAGEFRYEIRVLAGDEELASEVHEFIAVEREAAGTASKSSLRRSVGSGS